MKINFRYLAIILCGITYLFRNFRALHTMPARSLLYAFVLSIIADYYLIFTTHYVIGLIFFSLTQCCYTRIIKYPIFSLLENGLLGSVAVWFIALFLSLPCDFTVLLAAFYGTCLATNVCLSWKHYRRRSAGIYTLDDESHGILPPYIFKKSSQSFAIAITLLLLCDIHVALFNLPEYFSISAHSFLGIWCAAASHIIWFFYIPAQFLFSLQTFPPISRVENEGSETESITA